MSYHRFRHPVIRQLHANTLVTELHVDRHGVVTFTLPHHVVMILNDDYSFPAFRHTQMHADKVGPLADILDALLTGFKIERLTSGMD